MFSYTTVPTPTPAPAVMTSTLPTCRAVGNYLIISLIVTLHLFTLTDTYFVPDPEVADLDSKSLESRLKRSIEDDTVPDVYADEYSECNDEGEHPSCVCVGCGGEQHLMIENVTETSVPCCSSYVRGVNHDNYVHVIIYDAGVDNYTQEFEREFKDAVVDRIIWHCDEEQDQCSDIYVDNIIRSDLFVYRIYSSKFGDDDVLNIIFVLFVDENQNVRNRRDITSQNTTVTDADPTFPAQPNKTEHIAVIQQNHNRLVRSVEQPVKATMSGILIVDTIVLYQQTIEDRLEATLLVQLYQPDIGITEVKKTGWEGLSTTTRNGLIFLMVLCCLCFTCCTISGIKAVKDRAALKMALVELREEVRRKREEAEKSEANGIPAKNIPPLPPANRVITRASMQSEVPLLSITPAQRNGSLHAVKENGSAKGNGKLPSNGRAELNGVPKSTLSPLTAINNHTTSDLNNEEIFVTNGSNPANSNGVIKSSTKGTGGTGGTVAPEKTVRWGNSDDDKSENVSNGHLGNVQVHSEYLERDNILGEELSEQCTIQHSNDTVEETHPPNTNNKSDATDSSTNVPNDNGEV